MEATMKTKIVADEEDEVEVERFGRKRKKPQSDFMKQLTEIAQQVVEVPPPPPPPLTPLTEPVAGEIKRQVNLILFLLISILFISLSLSRKRKYLQAHLQHLADQLVQLPYDVHQK
jgi:hypothetical protein